VSIAFDEGRSADYESRVIDDHHQALKLWLRLLACTTRIEGVVRNRLRSEFATTLPRFDLLAQLEREPDGHVTGITDQLESEGLVKRAPHPSDRRAFAVQLTPAGRRQFRRMASVHEQWVVELFAGWSADEKGRVYDLLATLKRHLAAIETAPAAPRKKRKEGT
jgi:DNA-binding MarR family transcriptional regulator